MAGEDIGDVSVDVSADFSGFEAKLRAWMLRMSRKVVDLALRISTAAASRRMKTWRAMNERDLNIGVNLGPATARMAAWRKLQERAIKIRLRIPQGAIDLIAKQLASLSGIGQLVGAFFHFNRVLLLIHENILTVSALMGLLGGVAGPLVTLFGSLTISAVEFVKAFGGGLLGLLAVAPAVLTGATLAFQVFKLSLKDIEKVLGKTFTQYKGLQKVISDNFWKKAEDGVRSLLDNSFKPLKAGFTELSQAAGTFTGKLAAELEKVFTPEVFANFFGKLSEFFDILTEKAAGPLARISETLLTWGSTYFPVIAEWLSKILIQFDAWLSNDGTTKLSSWLSNFGDLLTGIWVTLREFGGVMNGIATAAERAGIAAFPFADLMTRLHKTIDSPAFQSGLTNFFAEGLRGAQGMKVAFEPLMSLLGSMAPIVGKFIGDAGVALGNFGALLFDTLNQPEVLTNFQGLLTGFVKVIENLEPAIGPFVDKLSQMMHFASILADEVSNSLSVAIQELAPIVGILLQAFGPLVVALGEGFRQNLERLTPGLTKIAEGIAGLVEGFTVFVEALQTPVLQFILGLLGDFFTTAVAGAINLAAAILKVTGGLLKILGGDFSGFADIWDGLKQGLKGAFQLFITLFAPAKVGKLLIGLAAKIGPKMAAVAVGIVTGLFGAMRRLIGGALVAVVDFFVDLFKSLLGIASPSTVFAEIGGFIVQGLVNGIKAAIGLVIDVFRFMVEQVKTFFIGAWNFISSAVGFVFTQLGNIFTFYKNLVMVGVRAIGSVFSAIWEAIKSAGTFVWESLKLSFNNWKANISLGIAVIKAIITAVWNAIKIAGQFVWSVIQTGFNNFKNNVSSGIGILKSVITAVWDTVKRVGESVWSGIQGAFIRMKSGLDTGVRSIQTKFEAVWTAVKNAASAAFQWIKDHIPKIDLTPGFDIPGVPFAANGMRNFGGGPIVVGERGPELVVLPKGSDVIPNHVSKALMRNALAPSESSKSESIVGPASLSRGGVTLEELQWLAEMILSGSQRIADGTVQNAQRSAAGTRSTPGVYS